MTLTATFAAGSRARRRFPARAATSMVVAFVAACAGPPTPSSRPARAPSSVVISVTPEVREATVTTDVAEPVVAAPRCAPADWTAQKLAPLLAPGKTPVSSRGDRRGSSQTLFDAECTDAPPGEPIAPPGASVVVDGVELRVIDAAPAGKSGRGWAGDLCSFEVRLADGSGVPVRLGAPEVAPMTTVSAVVRSGAAAWVALSFNGYTKEFPAGGNRIVALDLCDGRVVWTSKDSMSNGGLLLIDDYLVSAYGFTSERRYVYVLDARSGDVVQKLPVVENVCPSKSWAPHHRPGDRCDAPGQLVGAATAPRIEDGLFMVDTNTGSAAFTFR